MLHISLLSLILIAVVGIFIVKIAILEEIETSVVFTGTLLRNVFIVLMIVFISNTINQLYEHRQFEFILTKAIPRIYIPIAFFTILALLALKFALLSGIILYCFKARLHGIVLYSVSLFGELLALASFTMAVALILKRNLLITLTAIGFYSLSRLAGFLVMIGKNDINSFSFERAHEWILQRLMNLFTLIFPRFDLVTQTEWLIYTNIIETMLFAKLMISLILFSLLLLAVGCHDFKKQEF
ncbi:hypothetical protein [Rickettsiales endosymbiont of Stachyamoeba lipophora]|uniref:hypothetical protein n=1 Tax=Rickettsiales endosymbiont of Stachyamoeba lipophora TaxID=2486578 RepID=UPI000F6474B4|nr:hypothetical protein [Rickettsiales endosymbiont of Stachyamoeba lipophora]